MSDVIYLCISQFQQCPSPPPPPPRGNPGAFPNVARPGGGAFAYLGLTPGHLTRGFETVRRGLRCRLASPCRTREARGCSWMFLKVYFLNFRYFFIVKKQQLVLYSYITYREIENNQPGSGAFARFPHPHPGEFTKEMLMPGG